MNDYDHQNITPELIEKLKEKAMLIEDDLAWEGAQLLERTGKLCDPGFCEKGVEYENLCLDIAKLEKILEQKRK
jgi:hypothetical protein